MSWCGFSSDINECVAHTNPCLPGQTCVNTLGSYTCRRNTVTCGRGYHLNEDGTRCEGRPRHEKCSCYNKTQSHINLLHCRDVLSPVVTDIDECRAGNVCGDHGCSNLVGSYRCECRIGFIFNSITKLCQGTAGVPQCLVCFHISTNIKCCCWLLSGAAVSTVVSSWWQPPPPSVSPASALWWTVQGVSPMRWGSSPPWTLRRIIDESPVNLSSAPCIL